MPFLQAKELHIVSQMLSVQPINRYRSILRLRTGKKQSYLMPHQIKFILRHTKQHSSCRLLSQAGRKTVQSLQIPVMMVIKRHPAGIIRSHTRKGNPASAASDFHVL